MDQAMELAFEQSKTGDKDERYQSYQTIIVATDQEVSWAYEVWDQLIEDLSHKDNHQRSRASQYLAGLAKSDPDKRMLADFPKWIENASSLRQPHLMCLYIHKLASAFHSFYNECSVLHEEESLKKQRLALVLAVKITLSNALNLIGVSAPEKM